VINDELSQPWNEPLEKGGKPGNEQAALDKDSSSRRKEIRENPYKSYQKNQQEATPEYPPGNGARI